MALCQYHADSQRVAHYVNCADRRSRDSRINANSQKVGVILANIFTFLNFILGVILNFILGLVSASLSALLGVFVLHQYFQVADERRAILERRGSGNREIGVWAYKCSVCVCLLSSEVGKQFEYDDAEAELERGIHFVTLSTFLRCAICLGMRDTKRCSDVPRSS